MPEQPHGSGGEREGAPRGWGRGGNLSVPRRVPPAARGAAPPAEPGPLHPSATGTRRQAAAPPRCHGAHVMGSCWATGRCRIPMVGGDTAPGTVEPGPPAQSSSGGAGGPVGDRSPRAP